MSASSVPTKRDFSHLPARVERSAAGSWRASAIIIAMRVLGGGDRIAERRVHHHDAPAGGGGKVDVVDADAGPADHLEVPAASSSAAVTLVAERTARPS